MGKAHVADANDTDSNDIHKNLEYRKDDVTIIADVCRKCKRHSKKDENFRPVSHAARTRYRIYDLFLDICRPKW